MISGTIPARLDSATIDGEIRPFSKFIAEHVNGQRNREFEEWTES
jgi:hypothetical protein